MNSSQLISGESLIVVALAVVIFVFLIRRTFLQSRVRRPPSSPAREDDTSDKSSDEAAVEKLEVRIFDFAREVEARIGTRIAVLDRLIVDADREILRLQDVLATTKDIGGAGSPAALDSDPQSSESPGMRSTPRRQPDVTIPHPSPAKGGEREAA